LLLYSAEYYCFVDCVRGFCNKRLIEMNNRLLQAIQPARIARASDDMNAFIPVVVDVVGRRERWGVVQYNIVTNSGKDEKDCSWSPFPAGVSATLKEKKGARPIGIGYSDPYTSKWKQVLRCVC